MWWIVLPSGLVALSTTGYLAAWVLRQEDIITKHRYIPEAIEEGAKTYMKRLNATLILQNLAFGLFLALFFNIWVGLAFVFGSTCSALAGLFGMIVAVKANSRTVQAAKNQGLEKAFQVAFSAGSVMGFAGDGLALLGLSIVYQLSPGNFLNLLAFSLGATSFSYLAKVGGGVYTKIADIGADLVGKIEAAIPEDDPRNPAVIADLVGDMVGDIFGTAADFFDSKVAAQIAAMSLGVAVLTQNVPASLQIAAIGTLASLVGLIFSKCRKGESPSTALTRGSLITTITFLVGTGLAVWLQNLSLGLFLSTATGSCTGVAIGFTAELYTGIRRKAVKETAEASFQSPALNVLTGFAYGFISAGYSILAIALAMVIAFVTARLFGIPGLYGVALSAVGMLSTSGMVMAADAYGPISDNSQGIAEMAGYDSEVREITGQLDTIGNTTKAMTKGYTIGAASLTVLALITAYIQEARIEVLNLAAVDVIAGVMLGMVPAILFAAILILAVSRKARLMVDEVRRQFRELKLLESDTRPEYGRCIDIATRGALRSLVLPALLAIAFPTVVGFLFGHETLTAMLLGNLFMGTFLALFMANAGAIWDNAKKLIESGFFNGKYPDSLVKLAHDAAVIADTIGDAFKDVAGPSMNTWSALIALIARLLLLVIKSGLLPLLGLGVLSH